MAYDLKEMQESFYSERVGKVYGMFEVTSVTYDEQLRKQRWELCCTNCGERKVTYNGKDFVKGKNKGICRCIKPKKEKVVKETFYAEKYYGKTYGKWEVITGEPGKGWLCKCVDCGREVWKSAKQTYEGKASKCLCKYGYGKYGGDEWVGRRFEYLEIVAPYNKSSKSFHVRCDCGYERDVRAVDLDNGKIISCGRSECYWHGVNSRTMFGMSKERLYSIWSGMKDRCYNENNTSYKDYGGRGISICDEWKDSYITFRWWANANGYSDDLTIDRIDVNGNYEPSNCRWATWAEQARNKRPYSELPARKRGGKKWEINGVEKNLKEWCEEYGAEYGTVQYRMKIKGMTLLEALTTELNPNGRPKKK